MIKRFIAGKAMPWIAGGAAVTFLLMAATIWWLIEDRASLNQRAGELEERNERYEDTIRQQSMEYTVLAAELKRRDDVINRAIRAREDAERYARETVEQLREALAQDECANTDHPDVVADSLQPGTNHQAQD